MPRCKTISWPTVVEKATTQDWAKASIAQMKADYDTHMNTFPKYPPVRPSDWGHHYFCNVCGVQLTFDVKKPTHHECSRCGKVFTGEPYDGCWVKILNSCLVTNLERAAILAHLPDSGPEYGQTIHDLLLFYARHYHEYPVLKRYVGYAKVYPQSLSESIFAIALERVVRMTADLDIFTQDEYGELGDKLFRPMLELIRPQVEKIHNIHAWMLGAVAACANFLGEKEVLEECIHGTYGWINQLKQGITKEGIWYELSQTYHYYTINALLSLAWVALENDVDLFRMPEFASMVLNYPALAFPNGQWPAYNDGWFGASVYQSHTVYEEFSQAYPELGGLLAWIYQSAKPAAAPALNALFSDSKDPTSFVRNSPQALLYGPIELPAPQGPTRESILYPDTGIALLQTPDMRVTVKFSKDGGGHDHNDKISIEIYANDELLSYDPGTTGYALPLTGQWSRTSLAHNMVCVNYLRQKNSKAECLAFDAAHVLVLDDKSYENTVLEREITLTGDGFADRYSVMCNEPSQIDWMFHARGAFICGLPFAPRAPFEEKNGYDQLFDLREASVDGDFTASFATEKQTLTLRFHGAPGTTVVTGKCYGHDMTDVLDFIMLRRHCGKTEFNQTVHIKKNG